MTLNRLTFPLTLVIFFVSGFSSLVYQVVWVKTLTRSFGVTAFAVSAVLGAFFAGLALGSYLGGKLADRRSDGLRLYGWLEIAIGVYALALPALFEGLTPLVLWQKGSYAILLGSNQPIVINPATIESRFTPQLAADLSPLGITSAADLVGGFGSADEALRAALGPGLILSDDHPYNEYFRLLRIGGLWKWLGN